mgnify:CR=1 FL=1
MTRPGRAAYEAVMRRGRPALAWEVLRRDPAYCTAYDGLAAISPSETAVDAIFAAKWGLHFR